MMRALRDRRFMQFILWMIIVVFIGGIFFMWGVRSAGLGEDTRNLAAKVGDVRITYTEFNEAYQGMIDSYFKSQNEAPSEEQSKRLKEKVLDRLIEDAILEQTASKLGLVIQNEELMENLQRYPYFQGKDGKFSKAAYLQMLQANRLTPETFEAEQRRDILLQKTRLLLEDCVLYPEQDLDQYATFLSRDLKASYVSMDLETYKNKIKVSDSDLKDYYESGRDRYDKPERVKVRHLLLAIPPTASQLDKDKAKQTLEDYRKQVVSGKVKFEDLVKKYSQDQGSKDRGGELGWIQRDGMGSGMREFENVIFALKKGEVSKPVLTSYGYHLADVEDHEKGHKTTFAEVHEKVLADYKKEKGAQKLFAAVQDLSEKLEKTNDLAKAAKDLGLEVSTTPWFNRKGSITGLKDSKSLADQLTDLQLGEWKGPLPLGTRQFYFQILEAKHGGDKSPLQGENASEMAQRLMEKRQKDWLGDFVKEQRKKLNVKVYLNG